MPSPLIRSIARRVAAASVGAMLVATPRLVAAQLFSTFDFGFDTMMCAGAGCTPGTSALSFAGGAVTLTPWAGNRAPAAWWNDGRPLGVPSFFYGQFAFQDIGASYAVAATPITILLRFAPDAGVGDILMHGILTAGADAMSGSGTLDITDAPETIEYATPGGYGSYAMFAAFDPDFYYARGYSASGSSTMTLQVDRGSDRTPGVRPPAVTATPEPATVALLGFGLVGIGVVRRRRA